MLQYLRKNADIGSTEKTLTIAIKSAFSGLGCFYLNIDGC